MTYESDRTLVTRAAVHLRHAHGLDLPVTEVDRDNEIQHAGSYVRGEYM